MSGCGTHTCNECIRWREDTQAEIRALREVLATTAERIDVANAVGFRDGANHGIRLERAAIVAALRRHGVLKDCIRGATKPNTYVLLAADWIERGGHRSDE